MHKTIVKGLLLKFANAAKLRNTRARNLGADWEDAAEVIAEAEAAAADCRHVQAKILAEKAEAMSADAISGMAGADTKVESASAYLGGYLVVSGDNLWSIASQGSIYGNPFQWPLIFKANSGQIKDADLIFPGQYFYIPKAKGAERAAAIEHARTRGAWTIGVSEGSDIDYLADY